MQVTVSVVSIPAMSTIGTGIGVDPESDMVIRFAGDHRPMRELAEAIRAEGPASAEVEPYQVLESFPLDELRTPSLDYVYHRPRQYPDMDAASCKLCGCLHSGDAEEANPRHPEGCQAGDCPCHFGEEE